MKDTINLNIGSQVFTLDKDARTVLGGYLDDIRSRLPENDTDTMGDIERRIAEIFYEKLPSPMMVVSLEMVRDAMRQLGTPADFGERCNKSDSAQAQIKSQPRKLYRSRTNRFVAGICGGLAEYLNADPTIVRLLTILLIIPGGLSAWTYVLLWIIIPNAPARKFNFNKNR